MEGQLSISDIFPDAIPKLHTLNDYFRSVAQKDPIQLTQTELEIAQKELGDKCYWYFYVTENKCCGCYPMLKQTNSLHKPLSYAECLICGKKTKPVDDYSWQHTEDNWDELFGNKKDELLRYKRCVWQYLKQGPHTMNAQTAEKTRQYLEKYGVPENNWNKTVLPCNTCEYSNGTNCCHGPHTSHFEYDFLICDAYKYSCVERTANSCIICKHSNHTCNKVELWKVAESLDNIKCQHTCCRNCSIKNCGARCNGSKEPKEE